MKFVGFPSGKLQVTPLPDLFFGDVLTQIDDLAELKVTLHVLWRLAHRRTPLCLSRSALRADPILRRSLDGAAPDEALLRAAQRGTLIELKTRDASGAVEPWYFANTQPGRREAALARAGKLRLGASLGVAPAAATGQRPNIFTLYEQYIGMLTPLIAEQLQEAAQTYAASWIEEAFTIAAQADKRSWRYVAAILQRWAREGKSERREPRRSATPALQYKRRNDKRSR